MLDKSVTWHSFIMSREPEEVSKDVILPQEFSIRPYQDERDEDAWARIETSVGEFDTVEDAVACHHYYLSYMDELVKRQWFVVNKEGMPVATATIWWYGEEHTPCIHAWSCLPDYQHKGLGFAVAEKVLSVANCLHPGKTVWLETQTWSYRAIGLYLKLGFVPRIEATFNETPNDYKLALPILQQKMDKKVLELLETSARV